MNDSLQRVADLLDQAARSGVPVSPVRTLLPEGDLAAAYAVQKLNTERGLKQGRRLSGRKIGLTSLTVQKQLGVDQPDFGMLFTDMSFGDGEEVPWIRLMQPKCEAEVALVLERDLTDAQLTVPDLIHATAYALPAIEIVGSRIAKWDIRITDTIADNASSGLYVLGNEPVRLSDVGTAGTCRRCPSRPTERLGPLGHAGATGRRDAFAAHAELGASGRADGQRCVLRAPVGGQRAPWRLDHRRTGRRRSEPGFAVRSDALPCSHAPATPCSDC